MHDKVYTLDDFHFDFPDDLVAQYPADKRERSRLFVLNRKNGRYIHSGFFELDSFLNRGDVLVLNNAKVIYARIYCKRQTGGIVEIILTKKISDRIWLVLSNRTKRLNAGEKIYSIQDKSVALTIINRVNDFLEVETSIELTDRVLASIGEIALPPYIKRDFTDLDKERYQTVYSSESGAVAAPTAGLHFTNDLLNNIKEKGVKIVYITLDVSWGTFLPVREKYIEEHVMHSEKYLLSEEAALRLNCARKRGGKIIAVGTTSLRVLESTYRDGVNIPGSGETDIFIYPPKKVMSTDMLITNFHTPCSTLLMLVSAFAGYDTIMKAYREAIKKRYRFFSYGDAMLII